MGQLFADLPGVSELVESPTHEDYAAAARYALKLKRLPRAIEQISAALALAPLEPSHLKLLDEITAASRAPLLLLAAKEEGSFYGVAAVRARILARSGRMGEALELLAEVFAFSPATPYLEWARQWATDSRTKHQVRAHHVARLVNQIVEAVEQRREAVAAEISSNLHSAAALARQVATSFPRDAALAAARSRLTCCLGRPQDALELLGAQGHSPLILLAHARVSHALGSTEEASSWYERAAVADPSSRDAFVELGDVRLELAEPDRAVLGYDGALGLKTDSVVEGKRDYAAWLATGSHSALERLRRVAA